MIHIIHAGGAVIAEIDLEALYQRETISADSVKLSGCPACKEAPQLHKDSGKWYLIGNCNCDACNRLWALPTVEETV